MASEHLLWKLHLKFKGCDVILLYAWNGISYEWLYSKKDFYDFSEYE